MAAKISLTVQKGNCAGQTFIYEGKESLILGRQEDCSIVLPEATISRYHCLIEIVPPSVVVRDFGSLNGTFLNGKKIGQRGTGISAQESKETRGEEFILKPGDRLGLGKDCELVVEVRLPQYCKYCFCEVDDTAQIEHDGQRICTDCHKKRVLERKEFEAVIKAEAKRHKKELENKHKAEQVGKVQEQNRKKNQRCEVCGQLMYEGANICETCKNDPMKILAFLMDQAKNDISETKAIAGYRTIDLLGQGGMGQVWLVEEEKSGKRMALKLMQPQAASSEASRKNFLREAHYACQLDHKNIVQHYKCGQSDDTYFILMEYCAGGSVDVLINKNGGKLGLELATEIILQVLDGLIYAHNASVTAKLKNGSTETANGIVHRDFKPGNIFLTGSGKTMTAKVADFGLAKAFETSGLSGHTSTGKRSGTPVFMPRQQIINYRYSEPAVDVWATAATYYNMLTGTYVKDFRPGRDALATALGCSAIPIRKRNASIPERLAEVIDHALIEKPKIGVQSAAELKKMIEDAL